MERVSPVLTTRFIASLRLADVDEQTSVLAISRPVSTLRFNAPHRLGVVESLGDILHENPEDNGDDRPEDDGWIMWAAHRPVHPVEV